MNLKKYYLIFSFFSVAIIALLYGISPAWFVQTFFTISTIDINLAHIFRAIMGLYLGLGLFWLYAAFNKPYQAIALITIMIFIAGLLFGRIISFIVDGIPSALLQFYTAIEFVFFAITYYLFKQTD